MGCTTLLHPVFNNLEQVIIFCRVYGIVFQRETSIFNHIKYFKYSQSSEYYRAHFNIPVS